MSMADEIDYKLIGDDLQVVIITLDPNSFLVTTFANAANKRQDVAFASACLAA
jgi:hypothetical protein